jgi:transposase
MLARDPTILLAPEEKDDEIVVSKRKLDELLRQKDREIERLRKEAAELRRRLSVHENPNVPPSVRNHAPGYTRARPLVPLDQRKKAGSKPGHDGVTREPLVPDQRIVLSVETCAKCQGHRLKPRGTETEQEIEVERRRVVTEYTVEVSECLDCGATVRARLPSGRTPSGYGPQLQTEIVLGKIEERLPYRKLEERLQREGIPSCPATLQGVVWNAAEKLRGEEAAIVERLRTSPWVHADESSYRIDGRKVWIWTFCTDTDLLLVIRPSRGKGVVEEILGKDYRGQIVCDGWKGYLGWELQRCWAHLLRVAKARAEEGPTALELYESLADLYERLTRNLSKASQRTLARRKAMGERILAGLEARFGGSWGLGVGPTMTYLRNGRPWWLTFLDHPGMEATNNRAERGLREAIVIRKIIGTLRNWRGAEAFTRMLSVLGTWKLNGENPSTKLYSALS